MKTLLLSTDDIQNFSKLIYDPKTAQSLAAAAAANGGDLMALQYYLKHPGNYPVASTTTTIASVPQQHHHSATGAGLHHHQQQQQQHQQHHQQLLAQSQTQLKQLQLKQPTVHHHHHQQHSSYHHHHPYYQQQSHQSTNAAPAPAHTTQHHSSHNNSQSHSHNHSHSHSHTPHAHSVPVHALNQNSNFSAASSSTGGGTTTVSSHAPTQQSNTTGSSLSPPGATASARTQAASATAANAAGGGGAAATAATANGGRSTVISSSGGSGAASATKKLKTEPILSQFHQTERLSFANTHIVWGEEHWKRVVFQDERKFNLDGPDGFSYYFHDLRNYERTLSQRPRGNSVYIYLVVTAGGPLHLEVSMAKQKPETCIETILRERANIIAKIGGGATGSGSNEFVLQDHNWSANALPTAQEWLSAEGIKTQKWPTIAHDLNIMENVWGWLIREVYESGRKFSRKDDLIFRIREAWSRLPVDLVANLYSTLPERITELYYTRGVYTNC